MTAQSAQAIRVQDLEKSYKELRVLRGVDFDVAQGSIFALLGSNGAGKTTVVNILSTLLRADAGTATINGFDWALSPCRVLLRVPFDGPVIAGAVSQSEVRQVLLLSLRKVRARAVNLEKRGW